MSVDAEPIEHQYSVEELLERIVLRLDILIRHNEEITDEQITDEDIEE